MAAGDLHPAEGARILLERRQVSDDGERADYDASIYTPNARYDFGAALELGKGAELTPRGDRPDDKLERALANIASSIARAAKRKRDDELPPWPHRILRWRGPGRG